MTNYNNRRNTNNKVLKTFKDYLIPIVFVFIILLLIINNLFSSKDTTTKVNDNTSLSVSLGIPDTEAYVVYSGGNKTKLESKSSVYKTEKLQVVNGSLNIKSLNGDLALNKLGELRYNEDGSYTLYSADLWVKTSSGISVEMRYAKVSSNQESVFSLSQNEVASTIYVVSGVVDVQNLVGKTTSLQKGDKLVIMRNNANDENSDLSLSKEQIDEYTKQDEWFIKNNGASYLSATDVSKTNSGSLTATGLTSSGSTTFSGEVSNSVTSSSYISFNGLYDEAELNTSSIDISGNILSDVVFKIDINGKTASINTQTKTFSLKGFKLDSKVNDLVYRVYDEGNKLLYKGVLTIYSVGGSSSTNSSSAIDSKLAQVENYPITKSPLYQILTPKQNPYTSSEDVIRIEGTVPSGTVEKIVVNDFELKKFPKYGAYWSYFANSDFGNLKDGVNIYKIQYFGAENKLIYENNFTIIKEAKKVEVSTGAVQNTSSGETSTGVTQ